MMCPCVHAYKTLHKQMPPAKRPRNTPAEDMSEYKDAKGVVYEIQKGYTTGEVVILSDDLAVWKVQRSVLTENRCAGQDWRRVVMTADQQPGLSRHVCRRHSR